MDGNDSRIPEGWEGQIKRAEENFKTISELKEKLEILTEHVESRKAALEEEIEESLHEAIRNSRDCLEKIQENIDPKLEKIIQAKLEEIDNKMAILNRDGVAQVQGEIEKQIPVLSKKVLWDLDQVVVEKVRHAQKELSAELEKTAGDQVEKGLANYRETADRSMGRVKGMAFLAVGLSLVALLMTLIGVFGR